MNRPNNRQHQDTAKRIQQVMLELLEQKDFEHVTVRDICTKAKINRSTFYRHYEDIYDLMAKLEKQIQQGMVNQWKSENWKTEETVSEEALCRQLTYILEHRTFYRAYLREYPRRNHQAEVQRMFDEYLQPMFENHGVVDRSRMEYYYRYVMAGFLSVVAHWIEKETPESPEEVAGILYAMLRSPQ